MATISAGAFKDVLRQHRMAAALTQEELAEKAGISTRAVSDLERGVKRNSRKDTARMLAAGLGLNGEALDAFLDAARRPAPVAPAPPSSEPPVKVPVPATPIVGREQEIARVVALLQRDDGRLLTLTGPGGVGKTRLALQVARLVAGQFPDGVIFVDLSPLTDRELLLPTIAHALAFRDSGGPSLLDEMGEYLADKHLLLVLDNFEQLIDSAHDVARLLEKCESLRLLVTSRVALRIRAEQEFLVPPLAAPDPSLRQLPAEVLAYPAVSLFVQRARAIDPSFVPDFKATDAIAEICRRLDGLPLAIELVAARIKILSPEAILTRLERRLDLLTSGPRDVPARQQTMRAAIAWSYDLLEVAEQSLFRRLAVFVGGFSLEAAEVLGSGPGLVNVLDGLASLANKSLLRQAMTAGEPRFAMLETIQEYGRERLAEAGEAEEARRTHAEHFLAFAEQAESRLAGSPQTEWLLRLDHEHDNLRSALRWGLDRSGTELGLRLSGALWPYWRVRGHLTEGREWLERALAKGTSVSADSIKVLLGAAVLAEEQGALRRAAAHYEGALALARRLGDQRSVARSLDGLGGVAHDGGDLNQAANLHEDALELYRGLGDKQGIVGTVSNLGSVALSRGNYEEATERYTESLSLFRDLGDKRGLSVGLTNLGVLAFHQADYRQAALLYQESLALWRELGDPQCIGVTLVNFGDALRHQGDIAGAKGLYDEALSLFGELGEERGTGDALYGLAQVARSEGDDAGAFRLLCESLALADRVGARSSIAECLEGLGSLACVRGDPAHAASLLGTAQAIRDQIGVPLPAAYRADYDRTLACARDGLTEEAFAAAWAAGQGKGLVAAMVEACHHR